MVYRDGHPEQLYELAEQLARSPKERRRLGENAYHTIADVWNPENAAARLMGLLAELGIAPAQEKGREPGCSAERECSADREYGAEQGKRDRGAAGRSKGKEEKAVYEDLHLTGPCSPAPVIHEKRMYRYLMRRSGIHGRE